MKKKQLHMCTSVILISVFFLILFPFLGMTEFLENLYVLIFAFLIGMSTFRVRALLGEKADSQGIYLSIVKFLRSLSEPEFSTEEVSDTTYDYESGKRRLSTMRRKLFRAYKSSSLEGENEEDNE